MINNDVRVLIIALFAYAGLQTMKELGRTLRTKRQALADIRQYEFEEAFAEAFERAEIADEVARQERMN